MGLVVPSLDVVDVIGYCYHPELSEVRLNGMLVKIDIQHSYYDNTKNRLMLVKKDLVEISSGKKHTLSWTHKM